MDSLKKIQSEYLGLLDSFFSPIYHYADGDTDHFRLADFMSKYPLVADLFQNSLEDLGDEIARFWKSNGVALRTELKKSAGLKCLYSGDISPLDAGGLLKRSALYVDTTIVPDPVHRITQQLRPISLDNREYLGVLIRHVFNVWRVREVLSSNTAFPILVVAPVGIDHLDDNDGAIIAKRAATKCTAYLNQVFQLDLKSIDEFLDWAKAFETGDGIASMVKAREMLPSDFRETSDLAAAVEDFSAGKGSFSDSKLAAMTKGQDFIFYLKSYFLRVEEHRHFCAGLEAEPIYDLKRPWFFMNRDLGGPEIDTAIIQALQDEKFAWIGNAPIAAIKRLREAGELEYLRQVLRTGLHGIRTKQDQELSRTIEQVQLNLNACFEKHQAEVQTLEKKIRDITRVDVPLTVFAALVGWIPGVGNVISAPFSIRDAFKQLTEKSAKGVELKAKTDCAINFLFQARK